MLALAHVVWPGPWVAGAIGVLGVGVALRERRRISPAIQRVCAALWVACGLMWFIAPDPWASVQRGLGLGAMLAALVISVSFLGTASARIGGVREVGDRLMALPPRRRYLGFATVGQLFGGMLGLAGVQMMMKMAAAATPDPDATRVSSMLAVTRGFAATTLWSPMFSNLAVMLTLYPTLGLLQVWPVALAIAAAMSLLGLLLERRRLPPTGGAARTGAPARQLLRTLAPFLLPMGGYFALVLVASSLLAVPVAAVIIVMVPLAAIVVGMLTSPGGRRLTAVRSDIAVSLRDMPRVSGEVLIFLSSASTGMLLAETVPPGWVASVGAALSTQPVLACLALTTSVVAVALSGVHPLLWAVFMATAAAPQVVGLPPVVHLSAVLVGWAVSSTLSPVSLTSLMASRLAGRPSRELSLQANGVFAPATVLLSALLLGGIAWWARS